MRRSLLLRWWRAGIREIVFALDVDDGNGSPSLTKVMALVLLVLACVAVIRKYPVQTNVVLLVVVAISAAFGRSVWMRYLSRGQWSLESRQENVQQQIQIDQRITQEIIDRRKAGAEDGTEPA